MMEVKQKKCSGNIEKMNEYWFNRENSDKMPNFADLSNLAEIKRKAGLQHAFHL